MKNFMTSEDGSVQLQWVLLGILALGVGYFVAGFGM